MYTYLCVCNAAVHFGGFIILTQVYPGDLRGEPQKAPKSLARACAATPYPVGGNIMPCAFKFERI